MARELPGEAQYVVTAPLAVVRLAPGGGYHHIYQHQPLPAGVDPDQIKTLLTGGMIAPLRADGEPS